MTSILSQFLDVRSKDNAPVNTPVKAEFALVTFYDHPPYGDRYYDFRSGEYASLMSVISLPPSCAFTS
jgi:hypothetical protein